MPLKRLIYVSQAAVANVPHDLQRLQTLSERMTQTLQPGHTLHRL